MALTINNQNNVFTYGSLISGVSAASTGNAVPFKGMNKINISIDGNGTPSATGSLQVIYNGSQTNWITLQTFVFTNTQSGIVYKVDGPIDSLRVTLSPYLSGSFTAWYAASQL